MIEAMFFAVDVRTHSCMLTLTSSMADTAVHRTANTRSTVSIPHKGLPCYCCFPLRKHSCLSNLAEVCELLHWSLQPFAQDIADLGLGILALETDASEESTHLRRAAAYLVSHVHRMDHCNCLQMTSILFLYADP